MTPMRRQPGQAGPDMSAMLPPPPIQFAPPPPMPPPDASGAQAIGGGLDAMVQMLQARLAQPSGQGAAGGGLAGMAGGGPTDAPARRKSSFGQAAQGTLNYA